VPSNSLYRTPTVDNAVMEAFGMQPGMDRLNLLPRHDKKQGWIAPNALYQLARALVSPGVAAHGGYVSPEDGVNFAGNVSLGSYGTSAMMRNPAPGPGKTIPATVYHGSPHRINNVDEANPMGRFDLSKVGTGEGAQAYGHGVYLAESPDVARQYAGSLSAARATQPVGNVDLTQLYQSMPNDVPDNLLAARRDFRELQGMGELSAADRRDYLQAVQNNIVGGKGGNFYTVDLPDEHIAKMMDWDGPMDEQPELLSALQKAGFNKAPWPYNGLVGTKDGTLLTGGGGDAAYKALAKQLGSQQAASAFLNQQGLPGIRYLDGGSRFAGEGTRNFVAFDPTIAKILKRE
jgi:hypothetical protein